MSQIPLVSAFIGLMAAFLLLMRKESLGNRSTLLLFSCLALLGSFFCEGVQGLVLVLFAESIVTLDRFIAIKKSREVEIESELSGLFIYILPLLAFLGGHLGLDYQFVSLFLVGFFVLRLLKWPFRLPFEEREKFQFHNHFVLFWANIAVLKLSAGLILSEHAPFFILAAVVNSVVGFYIGALFFLIAAMFGGVLDPMSMIGSIGIVALLGKRWAWINLVLLLALAATVLGKGEFEFITKILPIFAVFAFLEVFGGFGKSRAGLGQQMLAAIVALLGASVPFVMDVDLVTLVASEKVLISLAVLGGCVFIRKISGGIEAVQRPIQLRSFQVLFRYLEGHDYPRPPRKTNRRSLQHLDFDSRYSSASMDTGSLGIGTMGQYLLWLFVLVFVLLLTGAF